MDFAMKLEYLNYDDKPEIQENIDLYLNIEVT